jgi:uncharacterized membrane protein
VIVWIVVIVLLVLFIAAVSAFVWRQRAPAPPPPLPISPAQEDIAEREARHQQLEAIGNELLDRRVALDTRRGPLGGDASLNAAFDDLEARLRSGQISEEEFEAEKVRLLGG